MKSFKIFYLSLFFIIMGCSAVSQKETVDLNFKPRKVSNLKLEEMVAKIRLSWDLEEDENYDSIVLTIVGADRLRKVEYLDANKREYTLDAVPVMETKFILKTKGKNGKKSKAVKISGRAKQYHRLEKTDEYIDYDSETVKFLFKTNIGSNIEIYAGEDRENLKKVKETVYEDYYKGIKVKGFESGKRYYYKIVSEQNGDILKSPINQLEKIEKVSKTPAPKWAREAIFYELHVRTFYDGNGDEIGDFTGLIQKLDYLKELGVDALWLMPCFESRSYHGYDTYDFYNIESDFGTNEDFEKFIKEAHKRGIKVILDYVVNHCSVEHPMFQSAINDPNSEYRDYFVWEDSFTDKNQKGAWNQVIWTQAEPKYYHAIFHGGLPDFNFSKYKVREEMKNIAKFWIEKGVDGFRLDASRHIDDFNKENTLLWWLEFNNYIKDLNPDVFIVGENVYETFEETAPFFSVMDSSFDYPFKTIIQDTLKGREDKIFEHLKAIDKAYSKENKDYINTIFLDNHDINRIGSELKDDNEKMKLAISILLTLPGTPFLYYGDELGQLGKGTHDNIREPFDWYKSANGKGMTTMEKGGFYDTMKFTKPDDGISLEEEKDNTESIYNYYKNMIKIRKENSIFVYGEYRKIDVGDGILAYEVDDDYKKLIVIHEIDGIDRELDENSFGEKINYIKGESSKGKIDLKKYNTVILEMIK